MFESISKYIYIVTPSKSGAFPSTYCYYINDEVKTLIDTPLDTNFMSFFENRTVDMILNTHFHRDHNGCNHLFPEAQILAHPLDTPPMTSWEEFVQSYGLENSQQRQLMYSWLDWHPSHINGQFENGDIIDLGKIKLEVLHTPGHTQGHCAFFWPEQEILFSGDIDLTGFGPWYGNVVSDVSQTINSIKKIIDLKPRVILSAHKGVIEQNITSDLEKYLDKVYAKERKILSALNIPRSVEELVAQKIIYRHRGKPEILFYLFEKISLLNHLKRLMNLGAVREVDGRYYAAV